MSERQCTYCGEFHYENCVSAIEDPLKAELIVSRTTNTILQRQNEEFDRENKRLRAALEAALKHENIKSCPEGERE